MKESQETININESLNIFLVRIYSTISKCILLVCDFNKVNKQWYRHRLRCFFFPEEYFNADYVIAFYFYLINKMRRNLIKIRSWAILGGLYGQTGFFYFQMDNAKLFFNYVSLYHILMWVGYHCLFVLVVSFLGYDNV